MRQQANYCTVASAIQEIDMSLDTRIAPKVPPCFGCHSILDRYKKDEEVLAKCEYANRHQEKACEGCNRR